MTELIAAIKSNPVGTTIVEVLFTDKGSVKDIPDWVKKVGHEMVGVEEKNGYWSIVVKKLK